MMHLDRLQHQIDILRRVAATNLLFDMSQWIGKTEACGSAACAFGYACLDPQFQAEGLRLEFTPREIIEGQSRRAIAIASVADFNKIRTIPGRFDPVFGPHNSFEAAAEFYGISFHAARYLFDPETYAAMRESAITPEDVIERVEEVIARDGVLLADELELRAEEDDC